MKRPFSDEEHRRRARNLRQVMDDHGLEAVVCSHFPNIYYLSGVPIHPFGRPAALVVPRTGEPRLITGMLDKQHARAQSFVSDIRTYADHSIDGSYDALTAPPESVTILIREAIHDLGLPNARIGLEGHLLSHHRWQVLESTLPSATFVDASVWIDDLRVVLSEEEIALVRAADRVSDAGQTALLQTLHTGISARTLEDACRAAMLDKVETDYSDMPFFLSHMIGLGDAHKAAGSCEWSLWGARDVAREGEVLDTVFSCHLWGYWGNVERAVSLGRPTPTQQRAFEAMIAANEETIRFIKPGVTFADVDRVTKRVLTEFGYEVGSAFGSGLGRGLFHYEGDFRLAPLDVRLYNERELEAGMVFSLEPMLGLYGDDALRHCNTVIVTEHGCEVDSELDRGVLWVE